MAMTCHSLQERDRETPVPSIDPSLFRSVISGAPTPTGGTTNRNLLVREQCPLAVAKADLRVAAGPGAVGRGVWLDLLRQGVHVGSTTTVPPTPSTAPTSVPTEPTTTSTSVPTEPSVAGRPTTAASAGGS